MVRFFRLSIRSRLIAAVGALAVISITATGLIAQQARTTNDTSRAALAANGIADLLIGAAGHWAFERGMTVTSLNAGPAASAETVSAITQQRATGDQAAAAALQAAALQPATAETASRLTAAQRAVIALRLQVDAALAQPRESRPDWLAPRLFKELTNLIELSQEFRRASAYEGGSIESSLARLPELKNAAWIMSEFAGRERAGLGAAIASGKPISPERMIELGNYRGRVESAWTELAAFVSRPGVAPAVREAASAVREALFGPFQSLREKIYAAGANDAAYPVDAATWVREATKPINTVLALSRAIGNEAGSIAVHAADGGQRRVLLALLALTTGVAVAAGAVFVAAVQVARPLTRMAVTTRRLADGELDMAVPCHGWHDELGTLSGAINVLREGMLQRRELQRQQAEAAALRERQQEQARQNVQHETEATAFVVDTIGQTLARMADRDLSCTIDAVLPGSYDRLRIDLGTAVDELRAALLAVVENAASISDNSASISSASDQLSARSQRQAASIEQVVASLNQLTKTVRDTAESAAAVSVVIHETKTDAERSGVIMQDAVSIMDAIQRSSRRIGEVTGIIDEMAFQTNLLALNAGVEAARAGEAGRGFAVVALEVRALAQRSAAAAKEIRDLIMKSGSQVETGVQMVGDAGAALTRILAQVMQVTQSVASIAAAAKQQSQSLHEFTAAAGDLENAAAEDAAMVEKTAAAARELSTDAIRLTSLTSRFRLTKAKPKGRTPDQSHIASGAARVHLARSA